MNNDLERFNNTFRSKIEVFKNGITFIDERISVSADDSRVVGVKKTMRDANNGLLDTMHI